VANLAIAILELPDEPRDAETREDYHRGDFALAADLRLIVISFVTGHLRRGFPTAVDARQYVRTSNIAFV
jgi:hypothetical protein